MHDRPAEFNLETRLWSREQAFAVVSCSAGCEADRRRLQRGYEATKKGRRGIRKQLRSEHRGHGNAQGARAGMRG